MSKRSSRVIERFPTPPGLSQGMPEYAEAQALRRDLLLAPDIARDRLRAAPVTEVAEMLATLILLSDLVAERDDPRRGVNFAPLLELRRNVEQQYARTATDAAAVAAAGGLSEAATRQVIQDYLAVLRFAQADALLQQLEVRFTSAGPTYWAVPLKGTHVMRIGVPRERLQLGVFDPLVLLG